MGGKKHRRVIRLSAPDQSQIERGELADAVAATHLGDPAADTVVRVAAAAARAAREGKSKKAPLSARDREMLENVPPHFGRL